jgi:ADP-heptose:LPS heptosyltransferase
MTSLLRRVARRVRDGVEGLCYTALAAPVGDGDPGARQQRLRAGMRPYRTIWWESCRLERASAIWGQVRLLERLEAEASRWAPGTRRGTLVVAMGHLGDAMHTLPLLRALRAEPGGDRLDVAAGPWAADLYEASGLADCVLRYEPQVEQYRRMRGGGSGVDAATAALREIAQRGYARAITTGPTDWASFAVVRAVRPPLWTGVRSRPALFPPCGEEDLHPYEGRLYEARRLLRLAGLETASDALFWPNLPAIREQGRECLASFGCGAERPLVVLAPGGGWPGKLWAPERFRQLADELQASRGCEIVVVGSMGERERGESISAGLPGRWNACGRTNLREFMGVVAQGRVLVCNDSAALHFAAAAGVPTVSLFGPTRPEQWAPSGPGHRSLRAVQGCPNCIPWHPAARCRESNSCMDGIAVSDVTDAVRSLLDMGGLRDGGPDGPGADRGSMTAGRML